MLFKDEFQDRLIKHIESFAEHNGGMEMVFEPNYASRYSIGGHLDDVLKQNFPAPVSTQV